MSPHIIKDTTVAANHSNHAVEQIELKVIALKAKMEETEHLIDEERRAALSLSSIGKSMKTNVLIFFSKMSSLLLPQNVGSKLFAVVSLSKKPIVTESFR